MVSDLQRVVALSTTKAEYVSMTEAIKEMVWLQTFVERLGKRCSVMYSNSQIEFFYR